MITRQFLKENIRKIVNDYPKSWSQIIRSSKNGTSYECLIEYFIPKVKGNEYTLATKVYWLLNDLKDFPKCMNSKCSNTFEHRNVVSLQKGYRKHCCPQCAKDSDERKRLYIETCRKNYGVNNISQYEGTKKKKEEKALAKYGVKNVAQANEVKKTIAETNMQLYGASTYLHSAQGEEHKRKTCIEKYGVDSFSKTPMHTEMMKAANQKNYGVDWPQQNRDFMREMLKKYTYDGMNFDSSIELAVYIYCDDYAQLKTEHLLASTF